jgi:hypothetical protein
MMSSPPSREAQGDALADLLSSQQKDFKANRVKLLILTAALSRLKGEIFESPSDPVEDVLEGDLNG